MSTIIYNDPESVRMRRNLGTLAVAGTGTACFGGWSVIKMIMECLIGNINFDIANSYLEAGTIISAISIAILIQLVLGDVVLRFLVARCARREGAGLRQGHGYLVAAVFVLLLSLLSVVLEIEAITTGDDFSLYDYASLFLELTSSIILIELIIAAFSNRRRPSGNAA